MEPCEIDEHLLHRRLRQFVMFTGLDLTNNAHHAAIYAEFASESRAGALPIHYGFLTPDDELFRRTTGDSAGHPTRLTGGGTLPVLHKPAARILKRNWPLKYLRQRPAVIVCFVDVEWDEAIWQEKKTECESKINSLRQSLGARDVRLALVLVPYVVAGASPPAHNIVADKKLEICAQCKLPPRNVFVLPCAPLACPNAPLSPVSPTGNDDATSPLAASLALSRAFADAVTRCETALHDVAQEAYTTFLKRIRARHVPNGDVRLIVRQQYKLAFICELRADLHSALRYYKTAYQNVADLTDAAGVDAFELASVAGLLNYKICELNFVLNSANDAIAQFHRHQKAFFYRLPAVLPSTELSAIEAAWWRSQQCSLFAELFERAVAGGLAAFAFQNPGRFLEESALAYQQANAFVRKLRERVPLARASSASCGDESEATGLAIDLNSAHATFYGQRPWRDVDGIAGKAVATQLTEHAAKLALETVRENYQKSLQLWSLAVAQFRRYACDGAQNAALIRMADDYVQLHKLGTALQLLHRVAAEFQARNLRRLLRHVLLKYLRIAYCMVNLNEYVWALVQLLNPSLETSDETCRDETLAAVEETASEFFAQHFNVPPALPLAIPADDEITSATFTVASTQWQQYYNHNVQVSFSVELSRLDAFLRCRSRFLHPAGVNFHTDDRLSIEVEIRNTSRFAVSFDKSMLTLEETCAANGKTHTILLENSGDGGVSLPADGAVQTLHFVHRPHVDGLTAKEKQIKVRKVSLRIIGGGESGKTNASFDFDMSGSGISPTTQPPQSRGSSLPDAWVAAWSDASHSVRVLPRRWLLRIDGPEMPIRLLVDEVADVPLTLVNSSNATLNRIKIIAHQIYKEDGSPDGVLVPAQVHDCGDLLPAGQVLRFNVRLSSKSPNCVAIQMQISGQIEVKNPSDNSDLSALEGVELTRRFAIDCSHAFNVTVAVFAGNNEQLRSLAPSQCVSLEANIAIERAIRICSIDWNLSNELSEYRDDASLRRAKVADGGQIDVDAAPGVRLQRRLRVQVVSTAASALTLGDLVVEWQSPSGVEPTRSVISLGKLPTVRVPLLVEARFRSDDGAHIDQPLVNLHNPFLIEYYLRNTSSAVLPLNVVLDHSDAFIFAGLTEFGVTLLPDESYDVRVLATPLSVGQLPFPRLSVRLPDDGAPAIDAFTYNSMPATVYVVRNRLYHKGAA